MKKMTLSVIALFLIMAVGHTKPKIKEIESNIQKDKIKNALGRYEIVFKTPAEKYFDFIIKKTKEGIIEDGHLSLAQKNQRVAQLEKFIYEKNSILLFRIRHGNPVHRQPGSVKITLADATGAPVKFALLDTTLKWTGEGTLYEEDFIIKTDIPLVKEQFTEDRVPLTLTVIFLQDQKLVYSITPK